MNSSDIDNWRSMGDRFSGENVELGWGDAILWGGILIGGLLTTLALRQMQRLSEAGYFLSGGKGLFRELCRAHRVDRRGRHALMKLAQLKNVDEPAELFLQPELFSDYARLERREQEALAKLKPRLFEGMETIDSTTSAQGGKAAIAPSGDGSSVAETNVGATG